MRKTNKSNENRTSKSINYLFESQAVDKLERVSNLTKKLRSTGT